VVAAQVRFTLTAVKMNRSLSYNSTLHMTIKYCTSSASVECLETNRLWHIRMFELKQPDTTGAMIIHQILFFFFKKMGFLNEIRC
jgi:hypothetical protein